MSELITPTTPQYFSNFSSVEQATIKQLLGLRALSLATKKKVSAIIANHHTGQIMSIGNNKMFDNLGDWSCEDENGETIPYVIHAEEQAAINFMKQHTLWKARDLTMYVSYAPCLNCAKMTAHLGINRVIFYEKHSYKFDTGEYSPRAFLQRMGFTVLQVTFPEEI